MTIWPRSSTPPTSGSQQRTGIRQRHIAAEGEFTSDLAVDAARKARWTTPGSTIADIDLIIVATTTPDLTFPATAAIVQQKLGMHHGAAFDIQAVCSGFVYAVGDRRQLPQERPRPRARWSSAPKPSRASSTGPTAPPACCSATAPARWSSNWRRRRRSRPRHSRLRRCAPTGTTGTSSTPTAGRPRPSPIGPRPHGGQARSSSHAVGKITDVVDNVFDADRLHRRRPRLVRAAPGQPAHHRRRRRKSSAFRPKRS